MTTINLSSPLRGDLCPSWCGDRHLDNRLQMSGRPVHPEDSSREHTSAPVDSWRAADSDGPRSLRPIRVEIRGWRYDNHDDDGEDLVVVEDSEGSLVNLPAGDARRLGEALIKAADVLQPAERSDPEGTTDRMAP